MPYETTSGTPGLVTPQGSIEGITASLVGGTPGSAERLNVEVSSRVHLECLSNIEAISKFIIPITKKKNGYIFNDDYRIFLNYHDGITLKYPGCWHRRLPEVSGDSLVELLAYIKSINLNRAETILAGKLNINEENALQNWKSMGWEWDDWPIYDVQFPEIFKKMANTQWVKYKNKSGDVVLVARKFFNGNAWVIEYFSRWRRNNGVYSHWVKALPLGRLPLFKRNTHNKNLDSTISIVSTEFDVRFSLSPENQLVAAIPGGAGNFNRTDLTLLAGRSVYIELLMHELRFSIEIEKSLAKSKAREVTVKIIGRPGPGFPLSDLRQIAAECGFVLPEHGASAPKLSSAGLISAGEPLPLAGSKRPQILEPILRKAGLLWFYGAEKLGKTWLALSLAHTIATGGSFGPWRAPKPRKVLFVDGEMHPDDLNSAIRCISKGQGDREILTFSVLSARNAVSGRINLLDPEWREQIHGMARNLDVVILDSFASLTNNKLSDFFVVYDFIRNLQTKNVGVIVIDHTNNKGSLQGVVDKKRVSDALVQLRVPEGRHARESVRLIQVIKSHHGVSETAKAFTGKMVFGTNTFSFEIEASEISEGPKTILNKVGKLAPIVIAIEEDKLSFREFLPQLGIKKSTASDRYKKAKSLAGPEKEALDREIQRLLEERKTTDSASGPW